MSRGRWDGIMLTGLYQTAMRVAERASGLAELALRSAMRVPEFAGRGEVRRVLGYVVFPGLVFLTVMVVWFGYLNGWLLLDSDARWRRFELADRRAMAVSLTDAKGRYFGIVPPDNEPDFLDAAPDDLPEGFDPDHKALPVEDAPAAFWACVVYTEDRNRGTWHNLHGVNWPTILAIPLRRRGGSTLEMQLARNMWKLHSDNSNPIIRKFMEWSEAPVLNRYLAQPGGGLGLRRWFAQHIPLVQGVTDAGGSVYGVYAAAQFLFGKTPDALDVAEQLLLAAAVRRPVAWPVRGTAEDTREARIAEIERLVGADGKKGRARLCAELDRIVPPADREAVLTRLEALRDPDLWAPLDPAIAEELARKINPLRRVGPMRMARELGGGIQREALSELTDLLSAERTAKVPESAGAEAKAGTKSPLAGQEREHPWRGEVRGIRVTVDVTENAAFRQRIRDAMLALSADLSAPDRFRQDALRRADPANPGAEPLEGDMPLVIAAADESGRIVRFYSSAQGTFYSGAPAQRPTTPGFGRTAYEVGREARATGSVAKIAAALLLAEAGETRADRSLDNACMTNAAGEGLVERCWQPGSGAPRRVTLEETFARSLNPPLIRVLGEKVAARRIPEFVSLVGFNTTKADPTDATTTLLTLGRYPARPKAVHWLSSLALATISAQSNPVNEPHFIESFERIVPGEANAVSFQQVEPEHRAVEVPMVSAASRVLLERLLSAPLCTPKTGTLRELGQWCAARNKQVDLHIAKSGTVPARVPGSIYDESDWWIAGAIRFSDGRAYSYMVSFGAGDPRRAFARELGGGRLAPFVDILLQDLMEMRP